MERIYEKKKTLHDTEKTTSRKLFIFVLLSVVVFARDSFVGALKCGSYYSLVFTPWNVIKKKKKLGTLEGYT